MWYGAVLCKFRQHLLGMVEGLFVAVRRAVAPWALPGNPGVFQSRSRVTLGQRHLGKEIVNIGLLEPELPHMRFLFVEPSGEIPGLLSKAEPLTIGPRLTGVHIAPQEDNRNVAEILIAKVLV